MPSATVFRRAFTDIYSRMKEKVVVGIGEVLWDELPDGKKLGGAPANFAYHVSQFGFDSMVVSAVGDDRSGAEIVELFGDKGLEGLLATVNYPTGTVAVKVDAAGVPEYDIKKNVAWDHIPFSELLEALAARTCAVCFGTLAQRSEKSRRTIMRFVDSIPASNNALVVFDVNLRQHYYSKKLIEESLRKCDVLKINDEELAVVSDIFGLPGGELSCTALKSEFGLKMLVLTCGTAGSYVYSDGGVSFQPTPVVEVADTVGAGDSFTAAFISAVLSGLSVGEAHEVAAATSAFVCTKYGAMPELPPHLKKRAGK